MPEEHVVYFLNKLDFSEVGTRPHTPHLMGALALPGVPAGHRVAIPGVAQLGDAIGDGREVLEAGAVQAAAVPAAGFGVLQEMGRTGEQDVVGQDGGPRRQQPVSLQQPQVPQVPALAVIHEDEIGLGQAVVLPQPRDHHIRGAHDQLHLRRIPLSVAVSGSPPCPLPAPVLTVRSSKPASRITFSATAPCCGSTATV